MFAANISQKKSNDSCAAGPLADALIYAAYSIYQGGLFMTINFNCQNCNKKVKAPEKAGGKWGKCPHCNIKCYIPLPPAPDDEELKLIPLEEEEVRQYEEKMKETRNLQLNILHETQGVDDDAVGFTFNEQDKKQLWKNIIIYLRQMADGELDEAQQTVDEIVRYGDHTKEILGEIGRAEKPEPELADIAPVVLKGLMRNLLSEINNE